MVGCLGSVAWVKVNGPANHENAGCVRDFLQSKFRRGVRAFVVDLEGCPGMDSTFIGTLYRLAAQVEDSGDSGGVDLIRVNERNLQSIRKLGLDGLLRLDPTGDQWREQIAQAEVAIQRAEVSASGMRERAGVMLEAHEALLQTSEENRNRFCDVVEYLRQDMEMSQGGEDPAGSR